MTWQATTSAAALLDVITADDLHIDWHVAAGAYDADHFVISGPVKRMLQALLDAYVTAQAGCTLCEAERRGQGGAWMALFVSQPSVDQVLNERFGDPNTLGLPMPRYGAWHDSAAWTKVFRSQFPLQGNALRAKAAREWDAMPDPALIILEARIARERGLGED